MLGTSPHKLWFNQPQMGALFDGTDVEWLLGAFRGVHFPPNKLDLDWMMIPISRSEQVISLGPEWPNHQARMCSSNLFPLWVWIDTFYYFPWTWWCGWDTRRASNLARFNFFWCFKGASTTNDTNVACLGSIFCLQGLRCWAEDLMHSFDSFWEVLR